MSKQIFDFQDQLKIGNIGESDFIKYYPELEPKKFDGREADFILKDGRTVELKSDSYFLEKTPNYFMEMLGNIDKGTLGGPFRASQDKIDLFVYYFPKNKTFFWFNTEKLVKMVEELIITLKLKPKTIWNKGWSAQGFAIPRSELESILIRVDDFNKK